MDAITLDEKPSLSSKKNKTTEKTTRINVQNIPVYCSIGCGREERETGQKLLIDISLDIDSSNVSLSDNVKDTMSYVDIYSMIQKICQLKPRNLIEKLAEDISSSLLSNPLSKSVIVKIRKPHIPFKDFQGDVSVEIEREK